MFPFTEKDGGNFHDAMKRGNKKNMCHAGFVRELQSALKACFKM